MTNTQHREAIASEVRAAAARKGFTQADVMRATGLNRSAVSRKWRGQAPITVDELLSIAVALDVPPGDLLPPAATYAAAA